MAEELLKRYLKVVERERLGKAREAFEITLAGIFYDIVSLKDYIEILPHYPAEKRQFEGRLLEVKVKELPLPPDIKQMVGDYIRGSVAQEQVLEALDDITKIYKKICIEEYGIDPSQKRETVVRIA